MIGRFLVGILRQLLLWHGRSWTGIGGGVEPSPLAPAENATFEGSLVKNWRTVSDSTQHVRSSGDMPRSPIKLLDRMGKKTENWTRVEVESRLVDESKRSIRTRVTINMCLYIQYIQYTYRIHAKTRIADLIPIIQALMQVLQLYFDVCFFPFQIKRSSHQVGFHDHTLVLLFYLGLPPETSRQVLRRKAFMHEHDQELLKYDTWWGVTGKASLGVTPGV